MAKKNMIERNLKRVQLVNKYNQKRKEFRHLIKTSKTFKKTLRFQSQLQKIPRNSLQCRTRNRCWVTGRSRGFYSHFGLSRHVFREMAHKGLLPGIKKSSW
uniref:Small ribosomal subunit protein uS14c n=1 Tax=Leachiella pacifica TaxID=282357 RepID=A0A3S8UVX3_9FLOR|nr:ribosomal protein S14 [Leachiella pacifica]